MCSAAPAPKKCRSGRPADRGDRRFRIDGSEVAQSAGHRPQKFGPCLSARLPRQRQPWPDLDRPRTRQARQAACQVANHGNRASLAPRERQLIGFVRKGLRNREIAEQLGVTEGTVKVYLHAVFEKLGVSSRTELAIRADEFLASS